MSSQCFTFPHGKIAILVHVNVNVKRYMYRAICVCMYVCNVVVVSVCLIQKHVVSSSFELAEVTFNGFSFFFF